MTAGERARRPWFASIAAVMLIAGFAVAASWIGVPGFSGGDAAAYVDAGRAVLAGTSPYDVLGANGNFGFIYPPFAALVFASSSWLPGHSPVALFQTLSLGAWALSSWLVLRAAAREARDVWPVVAVCSLAWYPVTRNMVAGQVDLILSLLVVVDFVVLRRTRWHGVLIGIGAGLKLTPLGFGLSLLVVRDVKSLLRAVGTAGATALLGFAVLPADSIRYWMHLASETSRSGTHAQALNQSWAALVARLTLLRRAATWRGLGPLPGSSWSQPRWSAAPSSSVPFSGAAWFWRAWGRTPW